MIQTLKTAVERTLAVLTGLSMMLIFLVVLVNSVSRYFFNDSFIWAESAATYGMIYGTVFGVLLAYIHDLNVRFTIFTDLMPKRILPFLATLTHLVTVVVGIFFTLSAFGFVRARGGILAAGLGFNMRYAQMSMVVFGVGLLIVALIRLLEHRPLREGTDPELPQI